MTINELVEKLEQVRSFIEDSNDDNVRQAFDDVNELIYDLENDGVDSNDGFRKVYQGGYQMSTDTASWFVTLFYLLVGGTALVSGMYFMYWMVVELPVLIRIKRENLYNRWRD